MLYGIKPATFVYGISTFVPGVTRLVQRGTGGSTAARYCYSIWLRHLQAACRCGMATIPAAVAELGPGDSLGTGLAALLSGVERYYALDVVRHANHERNLQIFDELVELFRQRAPIPDAAEFPLVRPLPESYAFPHDLLTAEWLDRALAPERLARLRAAVTADVAVAEGPVNYRVPWQAYARREKPAVEMFFSQAVLQHVDDLDFAHATMRTWLKPGGYLTHTYDFCSMLMTSKWNGQWAIPAWAWTLLRGRRPYLINRLPMSDFLSRLQAEGFTLRDVIRYRRTDGIARSQLARKFASISDDDLQTSEAFVVATLGSTAQT